MEGIYVATVGCGVWLPIVIAIWALIGGMIMGDIDPVVGITGIGLSIGIGMWVFKNPAHPQIGLVIAGAWLAVLFAPALLVASRRIHIYQMEVEQVKRAYDQLAYRPGNIGAVMKIASIVVRHGLPEHAVGMAETALELLPKRIAAEDLRQVARWKVAYDQRPSVRIPCGECGFPNPPGSALCPECGAPYLLLWMKGRRMSAAWTRRLAAVWIASAATLAAIPIAGSSLPRNQANLVIVGILGFGVLLIALSFVKPREKTR